MNVRNASTALRKVSGGVAAAAGVSAAAAVAGSALRRARWRRQGGLSGLRFDRRYSERVRLRDGSIVLIRMIMPWDKRRLREGMKRLTPESRYARFHSRKALLTPAELRYFSEVDGLDHFAIGAMRAVPWGPGIGVARFVRLPGDPDSAEAAVVVAESSRGRGLGRALFSRLMEAARERGIRTLICEILATNRPMLRLVDSLNATGRKIYEGNIVRWEISLVP